MSRSVACLPFSTPQPPPPSATYHCRSPAFRCRPAPHAPRWSPWMVGAAPAQPRLQLTCRCCCSVVIGAGLTRWRRSNRRFDQPLRITPGRAGKGKTKHPVAISYCNRNYHIINHPTDSPENKFRVLSSNPVQSYYVLSQKSVLSSYPERHTVSRYGKTNHFPSRTDFDGTSEFSTR